MARRTADEQQRSWHEMVERSKREFELRQRGQHPDQIAERQQADAAAKQAADWKNLVARAAEGDWDARDRVITTLHGGIKQSDHLAGRQAVLNELTPDFNRSRDSLPLPPQVKTAVDKAPAIADRERMIFDAGRAAAHNPQATASLRAMGETQAHRDGVQLDAQATSNWMLGWDAPRSGL